MHFASSEEAVEKLRDIETNLDAAYNRKASAEREFFTAVSNVRRLTNARARVLDHLAGDFESWKHFEESGDDSDGEL